MRNLPVTILLTPDSAKMISVSRPHTDVRILILIQTHEIAALESLCPWPLCSVTVSADLKASGWR